MPICPRARGMYTLSHSVSDVGWGFTDGTYGYMAGDLRILRAQRSRNMEQTQNENG